MPRMPQKTRRDEILAQEAAALGRMGSASAAKSFRDDVAVSQGDTRGFAGNLTREEILGAQPGEFSSGTTPYTPEMRDTVTRIRTAAQRGIDSGGRTEQQQREALARRAEQVPFGGARLTFRGQTRAFTRDEVRAGEVGKWRAAVLAGSRRSSARDQVLSGERAVVAGTAAGPLTKAEQTRQTPLTEQARAGRALRQSAAQQEERAIAAERGRQTEALAGREEEIRRWYEDQGIIPTRQERIDEEAAAAEGAEPDYMNDAAMEVTGIKDPRRLAIRMKRLQVSNNSADKRELREIQRKAEVARATAKREAKVATEKSEAQDEKLRLEAREDAQRKEALDEAERGRRALIEREAMKGNREFQKFLIEDAGVEFIGSPSDRPGVRLKLAGDK